MPGIELHHFRSRTLGGGQGVGVFATSSDANPLAVVSLLDAWFAGMTIAETLKVDRMTIGRWLGSRDSRGHRTPAISGAKPE
jgi:hypothetical protein